MTYIELGNGRFVDEEDMELSEEAAAEIERRKSSQREKEETIAEYACQYAQDYSLEELQKRMLEANGSVADIEEGREPYSEEPFMEVQVLKLALNLKMKEQSV